jgi:hypothetical protein
MEGQDEMSKPFLRLLPFTASLFHRLEFAVSCVKTLQPLLEFEMFSQRVESTSRNKNTRIHMEDSYQHTNTYFVSVDRVYILGLTESQSPRTDFSRGIRFDYGIRMQVDVVENDGGDAAE